MFQIEWFDVLTINGDEFFGDYGIDMFLKMPPNNKLPITFVSDGSTTGPGFKIYWECSGNYFY